MVRDTHCVTMVDIVPEEQCEVEWEEQCSHTPETQCVPVLETQCEERVTEVCEESREEVCTHTTEHVTEHHAVPVVQSYNYVQSVPFVGRTGLIGKLCNVCWRTLTFGKVFLRLNTNPVLNDFNTPALLSLSTTITRSLTKDRTIKASTLSLCLNTITSQSSLRPPPQ